MNTSADGGTIKSIGNAQLTCSRILIPETVVRPQMNFEKICLCQKLKGMLTNKK